MYTDYTWQDWEATPEQARPALLMKIINGYKGSDDFKYALTANAYFRGDNPEIASKTLLKARAVEYEDKQGRTRKRTEMAEIAGNRIHSGIFFRFVTQQNQFLLSEGVTLPEENKNALGPDFDKQLEWLGERALVQGLAWGFWNGDHLEIIEAAKDDYTGAVALLDEETSEPMALVQFWQIGPSRPMYIRLYEVDGVSVFRAVKKQPVQIEEKRAYILHTVKDALGPVTVEGRNYKRLPVRPLYANSEHRSELTQAIKTKIDLYDRVLSDFGDNLDRANDVYWVLNNFGGTMDEIAEMLEQISRVKAVANISDGSGSSSTAEPHTIEVPYAAREKALDMLERGLYQDYMALDMDALTGGSLTNVAIRAATANLNLKADRYEWQVRQFVKDILNLIGKPTDEIKFKRQTIANESEIVNDISLMMDYIDDETALKTNPYIQEDEVAGILKNVTARRMNTAPDPDITSEEGNNE